MKKKIFSHQLQLCSKLSVIRCWKRRREMKINIFLFTNFDQSEDPDEKIFFYPQWLCSNWRGYKLKYRSCQDK
jgi:hypothetical protein